MKLTTVETGKGYPYAELMRIEHDGACITLDQCEIMRLREHLSLTPQGVNTREMWAVVFVDGRIVTGSDCETEADAWTIALGWPHTDDIEEAKWRGVFAVQAQLMFKPPPRAAR